MRRKILVEISYTPEWGAETKKEVRDEEKQVIDYIRDSIGYDWHSDHKIKIRRVKNDTSRVQNRRT